MPNPRFSPEEFRTISGACRPLPLKTGSIVLFRYLLIESIQGSAPGLARRLAQLSWGQLRLLRGCLGAKREKLSRQQ